MSRVIAVVACGFTLTACSGSMPNLSFFKSTPPSESVRFETDPPGAEVKISSGQSCRTPCELAVQTAPEISATLALNGYQPQTVSLRSEPAAGSGEARLAPNPVYVDLRPVAATAAKKKLKRKPPTEQAHANAPAASAAPQAPAPAPATTSSTAPATSAPSERAASATSFPWPEPPATGSR